MVVALLVTYLIGFRLAKILLAGRDVRVEGIPEALQAIRQMEFGRGRVAVGGGYQPAAMLLSSLLGTSASGINVIC
jgi:hypothetical protein